jgi:hypothetical protein
MWAPNSPAATLGCAARAAAANCSNSARASAGSAEQLLWRLRSANVESGLVAPRASAELLASEPEQAAAQRAVAQFLANLLGR